MLTASKQGTTENVDSITPDQERMPTTVVLVNRIFSTTKNAPMTCSDRHRRSNEREPLRQTADVDCVGRAHTPDMTICGHWVRSLDQTIAKYPRQTPAEVASPWPSVPYLCEDGFMPHLTTSGDEQVTRRPVHAGFEREKLVPQVVRLAMHEALDRR